jgi:hypothetical protein
MNLMNFLTSTLAWFLLLSLYQGGTQIKETM